MHIFPALIRKLRRDVTDDKEVLQDWDFPFIHRTVDSIIIIYCASFDYNENNSKNKVTCRWSKFPTEPICFKKQTSSRRSTSTAGFARFGKLVSTAIQTRKGAALGYLGAKFFFERG